MSTRYSHSAGADEEDDIAQSSTSSKLPEVTPEGLPRGKLTKDLTTSEHVQLIEHFRGPEVTVLVGDDKKPYVLSKNRLCYMSGFFKRAFNSSFLEGIEQRIHLRSCSVAVFEIAIQWMHSSTFTLDKSTRNKPEKLDLCIRFLMFADEIDLLGPFDDVNQEVLSLYSRKTAILPQHIRTVFQLPQGNPLREVIAKACHKSYAWSLNFGGDDVGQRSGSYGWKSSRRRFRFQKELDTVEGFAADLLRAFHTAVQGKTIFEDPLTKQLLDPFNSTNFNTYAHYNPRVVAKSYKLSPRKRAAPKNKFTSIVHSDDDEASDW